MSWSCILGFLLTLTVMPALGQPQSAPPDPATLSMLRNLLNSSDQMLAEAEKLNNGPLQSPETAQQLVEARARRERIVARLHELEAMIPAKQ